MKTNFKFWHLCLPLAVGAFAACSDDDPTPMPTPEPEAAAKYFIAAENDNGSYFLSVDDLSSGTTTTTGNGIEDPNTYTHYAYNGTEAVLALYYRQGNPSVGSVYGLDETGELGAIGGGFQMTNGFNSVGPFENYIVTAKNGSTFTDNTQGSSFYFIDLDNNATLEQKELVTENLVGNGLQAGVVGIVDGGDGTFYSAVEVTDGDIDSVYVVKLDGDLNVKAVLKDDRIGKALGQWRSARYSLIANDDEGNTFVFGNPLGGTSKGGALKINKGASEFNADYNFQIQDKAEGHSFRKVWHITGKYFILEFYNEAEATTNTPAYKYGIVNVENQSFAWVTGLPDVETISNAGWPFSGDDKVYLPITTTDANPIVYVVDPVTAVATKGIEVQSATSIGGLAKLTY